MSNEPKLRTVNKAKPPYELNKFPKSFIDTLGKELVYLMATKDSYSLEGLSGSRYLLIALMRHGNRLTLD